MQLLVYQALDLITEQYARIKSKKEHDEVLDGIKKDPSNQLKHYNIMCFTGLI